MNPLVSCIMPVAAKHARFFKQALTCFHAQTYEPRELVIVIYPSAEPLMRPYLLPGVSVVYSPEGTSVGARRNLACEHARGEIIVHWDVDDFSAPGRIGQQVFEIEDSIYTRPHGVQNIQVSGYRTMLFFDERTREVWRFAGSWTANLGTSLCYRRSWWEAHPFREQQVGEDAAFINEAAAAGVYASTYRLDCIVARDHDDNTARRNHSCENGEWMQCAIETLPEGFRRVEGLL